MNGTLCAGLSVPLLSVWASSSSLLPHHSKVGMCVWVVVHVSVCLALWWTVNPLRMCPISCPTSAGLNPGLTVTLQLRRMDGGTVMAASNSKEIRLVFNAHHSRCLSIFFDWHEAKGETCMTICCRIVLYFSSTYYNICLYHFDIPAASVPLLS